jgi:hypothetical protein
MLVYINSMVPIGQKASHILDVSLALMMCNGTCYFSVLYAPASDLIIPMYL